MTCPDSFLWDILHFPWPQLLRCSSLKKKKISIILWISWVSQQRLLTHCWSGICSELQIAGVKTSPSKTEETCSLLITPYSTLSLSNVIVKASTWIQLVGYFLTYPFSLEMWKCTPTIITITTDSPCSTNPSQLHDTCSLIIWEMGIKWTRSVW